MLVRKRKFSKNLFLLLALLFGIFLSGCELLPAEKVDAPPPLIEPPKPRQTLHMVVRGDITEQVSGLVRVASEIEQEVYFTYGGRVSDVFVKYGDWVEEGQPLARLESGDLEYNLERSRLGLRRIEMRIERMEELAEIEGYMNKYDWESLMIDYTLAKMDFDRLNDQLEAVTLRAPVAGRIDNVSIKPAHNVAAYEGAVLIVDPTKLVLQMSITAQQARQLEVGMPAKIRLQTGEDLDAVVSQVSSSTASSSERFAYFDLVDQSRWKDLTYNSLLQTRIIVRESKDTLLLPRAALREFRDRTFVHIMDGDVRKEIDVVTGLVSQTHVEILEGLEEGQEVIGK